MCRPHMLRHRMVLVLRCCNNLANLILLVVLNIYKPWIRIILNNFQIINNGLSVCVSSYMGTQMSGDK
jgi:hypothetical protein